MYIEALKAAGANIHSAASFGDYQGTLLVYLTYKGETGLVEIAFGSCSHCDAFLREFDYGTPSESQLKDFGERYLSDIRDPRDLIPDCEQAAEWDMESESKLTYLKSIL